MRAHPPGCRLTETKISAYEREERKPTTANLNAMLKALEHAWKKRGLEFGEAEQRALFHTPTLDAATSNGSANEEEDADRRTAGKILVVGSLSAALAPSAALERITTHGDRTVDTKLIAAHEDIADMLATMHMAVRPSALVGLVARHADVLLRLLVRGTTDAVRKRVDVAVVESCAQAGLLGFFGGAREIARHYFALARTVSDDSGDDTLTGQALVAASSMYSPIPAGGRGGNVRLSVEMLQDATDSLKVATSDVSAWAYRWLGQELAAAGDERGFCQAMETTERLAEQPIYHDGRGFFARYAADLNKKGAARDEGVGMYYSAVPIEQRTCYQPSKSREIPDAKLLCSQKLPVFGYCRTNLNGRVKSCPPP